MSGSSSRAICNIGMLGSADILGFLFFWHFIRLCRTVGYEIVGCLLKWCQISNCSFKHSRSNFHICSSYDFVHSLVDFYYAAYGPFHDWNVIFLYDDNISFLKLFARSRRLFRYCNSLRWSRNHRLPNACLRRETSFHLVSKLLFVDLTCASIWAVNGSPIRKCPGVSAAISFGSVDMGESVR